MALASKNKEKIMSIPPEYLRELNTRAKLVAYQALIDALCLALTKSDKDGLEGLHRMLLDFQKTLPKMPMGMFPAEIQPFLEASFRESLDEILTDIRARFKS